MDGNVEIPWGSLPIEQFLIHNWDHSAAEPHTQQRLQLINKFLALDEIPEEWATKGGRESSSPARVPTAAEIDIILKPWRSHDLRKKAWRVQLSDRNNPFLLRTHYSSDKEQREIDDKTIDEWIHECEELQDVFDFAYFDDAELFSFGADWKRIREVIPEVAGPLDGTAQRKQYPSELAMQCFKLHLHRRKKYDPDGWKENPQLFIENAATLVQKRVMTAYLLIADEEAFQTGNPRLLYIDHNLDIIRESRVGGNYIIEVIMDEDQDGLSSDYWEKGIGEKYRVNGKVGSILYQLTEEDWADPRRS